MTSPNGNGAASNGAMHSAPKFDPTAITAFWMSSSARLMRSSEILLRGMTEVARLEVEMGQQYLRRGMGALQTPVLGAKPDQLMRVQIDQAAENVDSLVTTMRKIVDEFRHAIEESTQALFDAAPRTAETSLPRTAETSLPRTAETSLAASIHIDDPVIRRKPAPAAAEPAVTA